MLKVQYHLAEFNKPISQGNVLPKHIVERPAEDKNLGGSNPGIQYGSLSNFVKVENVYNPNSRYRNLERDTKPVLVYEENSEVNPQKFYGKRVATMSASQLEVNNMQAEIPNYAFMIFDVSPNYLIY
jgi:hypothetical protein